MDKEILEELWITNLITKNYAKFMNLSLSLLSVSHHFFLILLDILVSTSKEEFHYVVIKPFEYLVEKYFDNIGDLKTLPSAVCYPRRHVSWQSFFCQNSTIIPHLAISDLSNSEELQCHMQYDSRKSQAANSVWGPGRLLSVCFILGLTMMSEKSK